MTIHVVVGPPCAGKSTYVAQSAESGVPRFDANELAAAVGGDFQGVTPQAVSEVIATMRRGLMGWLFDPETTVDELWIVDTSPSPSTIGRLAGLGAQFHLIDPGEDECIARAVRDNLGEETEAAIHAWYANPPMLPNELSKEGPMRLKNFTADLRVKEPDEHAQEEEHSEDEAPAEAEGRIEAYASVFNTVDSYGDVVRPGAFAKTLARWSEREKTIPLLYGHDFNNPFMNIGGVVEAVEDERGLKVVADLDLDNPSAVQVLNLIKKGRLSEMSFAFQYVDASPAQVDGEDVYEVREVDLYEVSVVPIGANRDTEILSAKSARDLLTAVKQANLDADTESVVVGALTRAAEVGEVRAKETAIVGGETETDSLALYAQAKLAIAERMG